LTHVLNLASPPQEVGLYLSGVLAACGEGALSTRGTGRRGL